ncbi:hypothetical protein [Fluviicola sp.]|uniref:hypothetical protein n=1 Tax=Fluviicola sp. TaxID=1917219 RepID=UPI00261F1E58|nr:hypothetical protein [Fluviicola sp.]
MKRLSFYVLSVAFLATGMSSCGKTTRGKMINDWKVASSTSEETFISMNGEDKTVMTETIADNAITQKFVHTFAGGDSSETGSTEGKVNVNSWAIKKDGTWTWNKEVEYVGAGGQGQKGITNQSGTWSFIAKNKEDGFKKNERVLFNVLSYEFTQQSLNNGTVVSTNSTVDTYLTGQSVMIFTVKDSNNKLLEMEMDSDSKYTIQNNNSQRINKLSVRLK